MFTILLYQEKPESKVSLEKYLFMFLSTQEGAKLVLHRWDEHKDLNEIIKELETVARFHHEWRLIFYEGLEEENSRNAEVTELMRKYTKEVCSWSELSQFTYPQEVYHIVCRTELPSESFTDIEREFGISYRKFWYKINNSCEPKLEEGLFRLACAILALALNELPAGRLNYGKLYQLDIEINRNNFINYVLSQEELLKKIKVQLEEEAEILYKKRDNVVECPKADLKKTELKKGLNQQSFTKRIKKIKHKDLKNKTILEHKLGDNRRIWRSWIFFPKGVLRGEKEEIQKWLKREKGVEGFLSEGGLEFLKREKWSAIEKMGEERQVQIDRKAIELRFRQDEEKLKLYSQSKLESKFIPFLWLGIVVMQVGILFVFLFYAVSKKESSLNWLWNVITLGNRIQNMSFSLSLIIAFVEVGILVLFGAIIVNCLLNVLYIGKYKKNTSRYWKKEEATEKYMKRMINNIISYQYWIKIEDEQKWLKQKWQEEKECLQRHRFVWRNSWMVCQQLKLLLSLEEMEENIVICDSFIDFTQEPQETEYYWMPYKNNIGIAELGRSGYQMKVLFNFIDRVWIKNTP